MLGAVILVVTLVVLMPIGLFVAGMVWSAIVGFFEVTDAEERVGPDSELLKAKSW